MDSFKLVRFFRFFGGLKNEWNLLRKKCKAEEEEKNYIFAYISVKAWGGR